jgi:magnesium chelatase family protein
MLAKLPRFSLFGIEALLVGLFHTLSRYDDDDADVRGQEMAQRDFVIAAAGAHNRRMPGPPSSGETECIPRHGTVDPAATSRVVQFRRLCTAHRPSLKIRAVTQRPHSVVPQASQTAASNVPVPFLSV